jgi:hypothetical protein
MRRASIIRDRFVRVGLGVTVVLTPGCDGSPPTSKTEPDASSTSRTVEDLKKDLRPPVVIKPNVPPKSDTVPVAPKRELR